MGSGSWTAQNFASYTTTYRGMSINDYENANLSTQEVFVARTINQELNPFKVMRECCDSEEHPNTFPIILAPDVTGSMGAAARKVAQKLNTLMTELYDDKSIHDPEFCIIAIGDVAYDNAPIQITQFESDIRIAEQLDKVYFEGGGGGNGFESYSAAWYMGLYHCALDCWKRQKKGLIITLGDECPNPYISAYELKQITGDNLEKDVETKELLKEAKEKFEIYHLAVDDPDSCYAYYHNFKHLDQKWRDLLGEHYKVVNLNNLIPTIISIIKEHCNQETINDFVVTSSDTGIVLDNDEYIAW